MGTPNREPQEYSRNKIEDKDPGRYIPIIFLLCPCGSLFGVPSKFPLSRTCASAPVGHARCAEPRMFSSLLLTECTGFRV